jgi:hypothetical protein
LPSCWKDESPADGMSSAISSEGSNTVGPLVPQGGGVWRCLAVEKLNHVELRTGPWHTEPRAERQTCIDEVDFDSDAQPGDDPQNGP